MTIDCPICKKLVIWEQASFRPFCSERCKLIDLGQWADGTYNISTTTQATDSDSQVVVEDE